jgi:hypothetical protein
LTQRICSITNAIKPLDGSTVGSALDFVVVLVTALVLVDSGG